MLIARSTARRRRTNLLAASFAQLSLPWLAPAQLRWAALHTTSSIHPTQRPHRRSIERQRRESASSRRLATSADVAGQPFDASYHDHLSSGQWAWQDTPPPGDPVLGGPAKPVVIESASRKFEPSFRVQHALTGTATDLLRYMEVNLRIGRLSRARMIIERLQVWIGVTAPEVTHAHSSYLAALLNGLRKNPVDSDEAKQALKEMQNWLADEIQAKGVSVHGQMLAYMVRASIHAMSGAERDQAIDEYVTMGSHISEDAHDEVLFSDEYDDEEFSILREAMQLAPYDDNAADASHQSAEPTHDAGASTTPIAHASAQAHYQRPDYLHPESLPEVLATRLTGSGLDKLQIALRSLQETAALPADAPIEEQRAVALERQRIIETSTVEVALEKWRSADEELRNMGINTALQTRSMAALMWQWYTTLLPVLREEAKACQKALDSDTGAQEASQQRRYYAPWFILLPVEELAANTIIFAMRYMTRGKSRQHTDFDADLKVANMAESLGKHMEEECIARESKKGSWGSKVQKNKPRAKVRRRASGATTRQSAASQELAQKSIQWTAATHARVGAILLTKLMATAQLPVTREHIRTKEKVTRLQPALMHRMKYIVGKRVGLVVPHPALVQKLQSEPVGSLLAKRMPMIVEPRPWSGWKEGGYYHYENPIMRLPAGGDNGNKEYFLAAHSQGDLDQLYAGLTALSKVPWRVNQDILKVQIEAWNSGQAVGNFAPLNPELHLPPEPEPSADPGPRTKWMREVREIENKKAGYHSQRCFQNFQLEVARAMVNETLYFPHNLDFRGRAYPIPPYLNHMGADNARSMLIFAHGKKLGEKGLRWLKIHLANVAGHDKASLQEREDYTMKHLDDIRDSVRDPLGGRQWWRKSDDAWQTLAACYELVHALDSPDPHEFVSHLPVHQDGTCNGLQHYAALGGDSAGASHVNLEPSDRPADIYSVVADAVNQEIDRDAAKGHPVAKFLQGHVGRKVVKQPVMTNVYGVTFYGAALQVWKQLEELFPLVRSSDAVNHRVMALYISEKIFKSLGNMFTGAQAIQRWLGQCADRISRCLSSEQIAQLLASGHKLPVSIDRPYNKKQIEDDKNLLGPVKRKWTIGKRDQIARKSFKEHFRSAVVWTTPLGLPVVQPYRDIKVKQIFTDLQVIAIAEPRVWDPVNRKKQLQGFPPNFVHSLDATHMLLSALKCDEVGITFASIHDSFWTHACDINQMSTLLRDAFVAMHSDDIIARLHEELETRYKDAMYMVEVDVFAPLNKKIVDWRKENMSLISTDLGELALEVERIKLMRSSDEAERKRGEEMVTPGSLFEAAGDEQAHAVKILKDHALGALPKLKPADNQEWPSDQDTDTDQDEAERVKPRSAAGRIALSVWRPMRFPKIPPKGDFDVRRLRESEYFFS